MSTEIGSPAPSHRRRWSLSIRGVMLLVLIVGSVMGRLVFKARIQREAAAAIKLAGGRVYYDWQLEIQPDGMAQFGDGAPSFWRRMMHRVCGPDMFGSVIGVGLRSFAGSPDDVLEQVARIDTLWSLDLSENRHVRDESLQQLRGLVRLEHLSLNHTDVTGPGLHFLEGLHRLRELKLMGVSFQDDDLSPLAGLTSLKFLKLSGPTITDKGIKSLKYLIELTSLTMHNAGVTNAGLRELQGLKLSELEVELIGVTRTLDPIWVETLGQYIPILLLNDETLSVIAGFPYLKSLKIGSGQITDAGWMKLSKLKRLSKLEINGFGMTREREAQIIRRASRPLSIKRIYLYCGNGRLGEWMSKNVLERKGKELEKSPVSL